VESAFAHNHLGEAESEEEEARMHEQFRTCDGDQTLIGQFMYLEVRHASPHA
jgi:hypothetical protein